VGTRHTYRLDIAYDGAPFAGFQQQLDQPTVESALLSALRPFVPELPRVAVGGRTDRGVHALGQVVSFWSRAALPLEGVCEAIHQAAPGAIEVKAMTEVPRRFHASFSALRRHYRYRLRDDGALDAQRLDRMLDALVGERCFQAFARQTPPGTTTVRSLERAWVERIDERHLALNFVADRFLRRQVRVMVATAAREAATGGADDALVRLSDGGDRGATARPAPADGLYLVAITYPASIDPPVRSC
jgi:tRNA pseudouridine38-40 synthase